MHVILSAFGTRGDVQPLIALALGLVQRNHRVTLVAPPDFAEEAGAFGIPFVPMGLSIRGMLQEHRDKLGANPFKIIHAIRRDAARDIGHQFEAVREAARGADAIIGAGIMWAAASVAQAFDRPYWYIAYAPEAFESDHYPPMFIPFGGMPRWANRWGWKLFAALIEWVVRAPINRQRALLGLGPVKATIPLTFDESRALLGADPELAPWPPDVDGAAPPSGWLALPDRRDLSPRLEAFLDEGSPPIYFGFGSMTDPDPARTTRILLEAARAVNRRAVISTGWAGLGENHSLGEDALVIGAVPHQKLFSRVVAVVHHGGAGTTHAAARAGVPQVIVPHILDQYSWARRVAHLGLGPPPLPRGQLSAARLIARLQCCLANRDMSRRAMELAARIDGRDGVANIVGFIERQLGAGDAKPRKSLPPRSTAAANPVVVA
jgi:vancomycin aglycone glucosyltransferase